MTETNLENVKEEACFFARFPLIKTDMSPMIVHHPFIRSGYISYKNKKGQNVQANLLEDKEALAFYQEKLLKQIEQAKNVEQIRGMITFPYRLWFLEKVEKYLSEKDYAEFLANAYISTEHPDEDPKMNKKKLVSMFSKANKQYLMRKEEALMFAELPEIVTVYRGVETANVKKMKGLSWTVDCDIAKWFATRFGNNGTVYSAKIDKEYIFAYFNLRDEKEVVLNPAYLKEITSSSVKKISVEKEKIL